MTQLYGIASNLTEMLSRLSITTGHSYRLEMDGDRGDLVQEGDEEAVIFYGTTHELRCFMAGVLQVYSQRPGELPSLRYRAETVQPAALANARTNEMLHTGSSASFRGEEGIQVDDHNDEDVPETDRLTATAGLREMLTRNGISVDMLYDRRSAPTYDQYLSFIHTMNDIDGDTYPVFTRRQFNNAVHRLNQTSHRGHPRARLIERLQAVLSHEGLPTSGPQACISFSRYLSIRTSMDVTPDGFSLGRNQFAEAMRTITNQPAPEQESHLTGLAAYIQNIIDTPPQAEDGSGDDNPAEENNTPSLSMATAVEVASRLSSGLRQGAASFTRSMTGMRELSRVQDSIVYEVNMPQISDEAMETIRDNIQGMARHAVGGVLELPDTPPNLPTSNFSNDPVISHRQNAINRFYADMVAEHSTLSMLVARHLMEGREFRYMGHSLTTEELQEGQRIATEAHEVRLRAQSPRTTAELLTEAGRAERRHREARNAATRRLHPGLLGDDVATINTPPVLDFNDIENRVLAQMASNIAEGVDNEILENLTSTITSTRIGYNLGVSEIPDNTLVLVKLDDEGEPHHIFLPMPELPERVRLTTLVRLVRSLGEDPDDWVSAQSSILSWQVGSNVSLRHGAAGRLNSISTQREDVIWNGVEVSWSFASGGTVQPAAPSIPSEAALPTNASDGCLMLVRRAGTGYAVLELPLPEDRLANFDDLRDAIQTHGRQYSQWLTTNAGLVSYNLGRNVDVDVNVSMHLQLLTGKFPNMDGLSLRTMRGGEIHDIVLHFSKNTAITLAAVVEHCWSTGVNPDNWLIPSAGLVGWSVGDGLSLTGPLVDHLTTLTEPPKTIEINSYRRAGRSFDTDL